MKELKVNKSLCIGCGACVSIDEEHFTFSDDGLSEIKKQPEEITETVIDAMDSCPVNAILLEEKLSDDDLSEIKKQPEEITETVIDEMDSLSS